MLDWLQITGSHKIIDRFIDHNFHPKTVHVEAGVMEKMNKRTVLLSNFYEQMKKNKYTYLISIVIDPTPILCSERI